MGEPLIRHPIRQIAYYCDNVVAAARHHAALFGSGPYFVTERVPLTYCSYRGAPGHLDHISALGQWGEVMIEFCTQFGDDKSAFRDLYPNGGGGIHHVTLIVADQAAEVRRFNEAGYETVTDAEGAGIRFVMVDTVRDLGHFVELYEPSPGIVWLYGMVRDAARDFDGGDLIRPLTFS